MEIVYFSPTGNVKYLAQRLAEELHLKHTAAKIWPLEHTDPATLEKNGDMVLMYAVYGFNAPRTVVRFARSLPSGHFNQCGQQYHPPGKNFLAEPHSA